MRHIQKGGEPKALRDWKRANKKIPENLFYGRRSTFPTSAVKDALLKEQFHLCAYTMKRLSTVDDFHIEHIQPQSITKKKPETKPLEVDYTNMLACFPPKSDRAPGYGAPWKADYEVTDENFVSPLHGSCEKRFLYKPDGTVKEANGDGAAKETIKALVLNHDVLVELRERELRAYGIVRRGTRQISAKKAKELAESIMQPDSEGCLPEYCVAVRQVAEKYANREEQWASARKKS